MSDPLTPTGDLWATPKPLTFVEVCLMAQDMVSFHVCFMNALIFILLLLGGVFSEC